MQDHDFNGAAPDLGAIEWVVGAPELLNSFVDEQDSSVILHRPVVSDDSSTTASTLFRLIIFKHQ